MNYPCVESTEEFQVGDHKIRLWRDEARDADQESYQNGDIKIIAAHNKDLSQSDLAKLIASLDRVNAVHIHNPETGSGRVIYVNWP